MHRFWECIIAGTYPGHGETYLDPDDVLWWSKGGVLRGESPARIAFLREDPRDAPPEGIEPIDKWQMPNVAGKPGEYYLVYFGRRVSRSSGSSTASHSGMPSELASGMKFHVDVLDTWNMTVTPDRRVRSPSGGRTTMCSSTSDDRAVDLPGRPWMALRITASKTSDEPP